MMPGPAGQPALRGMVPDLPDIGWREPPSAAAFGGISLVHEAAAKSASAAYPSPAPIAAAIMPRVARAAARAITDRLRRAYSARLDAARPLRQAAQRRAAIPSHQLPQVGRGSFAGVKEISPCFPRPAVARCQWSPNGTRHNRPFVASKIICGNGSNQCKQLMSDDCGVIPSRLSLADDHSGVN